MPYHKPRVSLWNPPERTHSAQDQQAHLAHHFMRITGIGKLKECGVHSVEQLAEHHIQSLATQRVQEAQEKGKASRD